jgi:hypothetical protein
MLCGNRLPFQIFPGIFSSIDSYSKKITDKHFRHHGRVPKWFEGFGELGAPIAVPAWQQFQMLDSQTNILVTGVPDEMLRHPKHGIWIGDYKTARFTDAQDTLAPMYQVQLNSYALIAPKISLGPVYGLGLLYYEPITDLREADPDSLIKDDRFYLEFAPKLKSVKLEPNLIPPLLNRVREICDTAEIPAARLDCRDCSILENLIRGTGKSVQSVEQDLLRSLDAERAKRAVRAKKESRVNCC